MKRAYRNAILICLLAAAFSQSLFSAPKISLRVNGKWIIRLRAAELTGGAGTDFINDMESATNEISITLSKTQGPTAPWRIDLKRVDTTWESGVLIYARLTSAGTGDGTVSGGAVYQAVTAIDQEFLNGTGDRDNLEVQLKISGVSAGNLLAQTYLTTLYYTVTEL